MSEWIEWSGGPQPVADETWVEVSQLYRADDRDLARCIAWDYKLRYRILNQHLIDAARKEGLQMGLEAFDEARLAVEGDIQKLCDAARLGGIRLGLEAADKAIEALVRTGDLHIEGEMALEEASIAICTLNSEAIAKETAR